MCVHCAYVVRPFRLCASPRRENVFPAPRPAPLRHRLRYHHGRIIQRRPRPEAHRVAGDTPPRVTLLGPSPRQRAQIKCTYLYIISIHLRSVLCARALYRKFNDPTPPPRTRVFILSPCRRRSWWSLLY